MYKVLLVEDEIVIRQGMRELISRSAPFFEVTAEMPGGREALTYLKSELPDVMITDIRMKEMDGLALAGKVKSMYPELLVIIVSGYGEFEYAQKAIEYGVLHYLLKPVERHELVSVLEKARLLLDKRHGTAALEQAPEPFRVEGGGDTRKIIRDVKEYVRLHIDGDLRLQTVASHVNLNATYLSQLFKGETDCNYSDYVTDSRMERAKWLLSHTQLKIYDVARLSGHQSPKHFMLVFKQQTGVTAGEYRNQFNNQD